MVDNMHTDDSGEATLPWLSFWSLELQDEQPSSGFRFPERYLGPDPHTRHPKCQFETWALCVFRGPEDVLDLRVSVRVVSSRVVMRLYGYSRSSQAGEDRWDDYYDEKDGDMFVHGYPFMVRVGNRPVLQARQPPGVFPLSVSWRGQEFVLRNNNPLWILDYPRELRWYTYPIVSGDGYTGYWHHSWGVAPSIGFWSLHAGLKRPLPVRQKSEKVVVFCFVNLFEVVVMQIQFPRVHLKCLHKDGTTSVFDEAHADQPSEGLWLVRGPCLQLQLKETAAWSHDPVQKRENSDLEVSGTFNGRAVNGRAFLKRPRETLDRLSKLAAYLGRPDPVYRHQSSVAWVHSIFCWVVVLAALVFVLLQYPKKEARQRKETPAPTIKLKQD